MTLDDLLAQAEHARSRGDVENAGRLYFQALAIDRSQAALYGLGTLLLGVGRNQEALPLLREAAGISESLAVTTGLVLCLAALGQWDAARSEADALLQIRSSSPRDWLQAGQALVHLNMDAQAEVALGRTIACGDRSRLALYGLGFVLHRQGRWSEALQYYDSALAQGGDEPGLLSNMAMCEQRLHRYGRAFGLLERAARLAPDDVSILSRLVEVSAMRCAFDAERKYASLLDEALRSAAPRGRPDPLVALYAPLSADATRRVFDMAAGSALSARPPVPTEPTRRVRRQADRLRIGYLSSDFCGHAVGRLFAGYVGDHDRERAHVHAYSLRRSDDQVAAAIRTRVETFQDLDGLSAAAIVDAIRSDGLDLLIDLNGYTYGAKPEVLAARPAPRQVSYLGLIHDHRAPWLDGVILDSVVATPEMRAGFMNKVIDLPGTMFPPACDIGPEADQDWLRGSAGIADTSFLMCSFANAYKIDKQVLHCWVEIMRRLDDGVLMLYADAEAAPALEAAWTSQGGPRERLVCVPRTSAGEYMARLRASDLMLDTFRYGGGATSVDAIMQGLPVLTMQGAAPVARMAASLNRFLGMDSLVAATPADYVDRAVAAARARKGLRSRLHEAVDRSGFRQGRRIADAVEKIASRWAP
ncbi:tetratricopeptide repeat protein [Luteimonas sp. MJ293]|uniref:O-linked N-acetylglucosamine transferase, SPINDLY family protein n=1 Tax=Luteimonas sp. MJ146 TaxID=3129240 RepID=UPI0031BB86E3